MLIIFGKYLGSNFRDESLNIEFLLLYNSTKCLNCNIIFSIHTNKHTFQVGFHLAVIQMTQTKYMRSILDSSIFSLIPFSLLAVMSLWCLRARSAARWAQQVGAGQETLRVHLQIIIYIKRKILKLENTYLFLLATNEIIK